MGFLRVSAIQRRDENDFILKDINFTQRRFKKIAIAGETGSGKSTLLKIIAGLAQPDSGQVLFEDKRVLGSDEKLVAGHPSIAYLSQHSELPKFLRVEQILSYSNKLDDNEANLIYEVCDITHLLSRKTDQLSGGERQRIALALLLIRSPKLLLLDEPFSNLDMPHKIALKHVIKRISDRLKITCILVSHDPFDTLSWADQIIILKEGKVIQQGIPEKIYRYPVNEYVAGLFGEYTVLTNEQALMFSKKQGIKLKRKNVLLRPESVIVSTSARKGLKGKVDSVHYLGSYYILQVSIFDISMKVRTIDQQYSVNDIVYLAFIPDRVWYI